ncbi:hypothetical protein Mic7113_3580 [Allocoleopsis franciscana PCC 7113]|uniref:Uncharacterized protein n=1 Tax=Allocoleopsis franciscana PCC 7113 TaxID=1173027 RepID=K9WHP9_9CYAN|nr:hypothetical protein Mic7113_3580 [Allocoleopsis franciscana PCC 7113]
MFPGKDIRRLLHPQPEIPVFFLLLHFPKMSGNCHTYLKQPSSTQCIQEALEIGQ